MVPEQKRGRGRDGGSREGRGGDGLLAAAASVALAAWSRARATWSSTSKMERMVKRGVVCSGLGFADPWRSRPVAASVQPTMRTSPHEDCC